LKKIFGVLKRRCRRGGWNLRKRTSFFEKIIIKQYLQSYEVAKLQIGCGGQLREGWLNANYESWRKSTIFLNASKPFPIHDEQFDFVFSEHMIEHITFEQGKVMLRECYRILKPGGAIRISTPDLAFLIRLYGVQNTNVEESYIQWAVKTLPCVLDGCEDTFVINNFVRDWGHQFIYDEKTLKAALEYAGFVDVRSVEINQSYFPELAGMESESRMPDGFLKLESVAVEAVKR